MTGRLSASISRPTITRRPNDSFPNPGTYVWQQGASVISESLATGTEPLIAAEHALHVLEIIEAARAFRQTGARSHWSRRSNGQCVSRAGALTKRFSSAEWFDNLWGRA